MSTEEMAASTAADHKLRIALAGNPNCGKTTLFNTYTGARQQVGNYPGVTVDRKEGFISVGNDDITLVDIPGTYSLTAYSMEELVARDELSFGHVEAVIDCADASALERNLLLTVQMMEMGMPIVLACNMMDEARKAGIHIDMDKLSKLMGIPAMPLVAPTGEGAEDIIRKAVELAKKGRKEPLQISYGKDIDAALDPLEKRIRDEKILTDRYHAHWTAIKLLEGDAQVRDAVDKARPDVAQELKDYCAKVEQRVHDTLDSTCESVITDARFGYVRGVLKGVITQDPGKDRLAFTDKMDKVLTHALFGPLIMIGVLYVMFWLTFEVGAIPQGWVEDGFTWLGDTVSNALGEGMLRDVIVDGIIGGVGGVMSFVPLIAIMFLLVAFIEDSGYMARVAYMMDRIFRAFGLHGASVMPYIVAGGIAGGCAIPGAMATRTLRSPKEKLATLLTMPYFVCGAKVPVMLLLIGTFFPEKPVLAFFMILAAGWVSALFIAFCFRHTFIKGDATPFVMELPPYRFPTAFALALHCWERCWMYMKKAGTIILAISILIWASLNFPQLPEDNEFDTKIASLNGQVETLEGQLKPFTEKLEAIQDKESAEAKAITESEEYKKLSEQTQALKDQVEETNQERDEFALRQSYAGRIGVALEPVTKYAGFTWQSNIALVAGIAAKEAIVSTLGTAYSMGKDVDADEAAEQAEDESNTTSLAAKLKADPAFSKAGAVALMLFVLMYSPCFVALVVIKSEAGGWKWLFFSIFFNTAWAYLVSVIAFNIAKAVL